jgi:hypothetical protein
VLRRAAAPQKRGFRKLQRRALRRARLRGLIGPKPEAAVDASGLDGRHCSSYFQHRRSRHGKAWRRFPLLAVVSHTQSHLIAACALRLGPTNESPLFTDLVDEAVRVLGVPWDRLLADAAYDAEHHHVQCREDSGIRSTVIPVNRRGRGGPPRAKYRGQMHRHFFRKVYGQRWQAESVFSRHKRVLGAALRGRSFEAWERECRLRVLTHNVMLLAAAA